MYQKPKSLFSLIMLAFLAGIAGFVILAIFTSLSNTMMIIGLIINLLIVLLLLGLFIYAVINLIRFIRDKENKKSSIMHFVNVVFSFIIAGGFLTIYLLILTAGSLLDLPFNQ